ncbi:WD repeat-containing protein 25 [Phytophthora pseudosyringae]|uniref:WD repeat-containing protein 25 n=1 Tax=Phytophthora pseudosyringae TaxID=221518 RepID=A0A8T1WJI4_9STRA|nr:WD repeat-containing protein 25 [Phytophthora pseudosyringae]
MDSLLEYVSPPSSPPRGDGLPTTAASDAETRRLLVAQRIAGQRRAFAHHSTREEATFAFRGYAAKRRRRHARNEPQKYFKSIAREQAEGNAALPLFKHGTKVPSDLTADSKLERAIPLRRRNRQRFVGHHKAVNELQWHPTYPNLFLSVSMDATVRVWNASAVEDERCQRLLTHHSLGVKSAKWSLDGRQILSGGYDGLAFFVDAETGQALQELRRPDVGTTSASIERITTVRFHPTESSSVLLGTDKGRIYCHDLREKTPQHPVITYTKSFGDVHDLLFLGIDGQRFVSSAGVMQRDASNQTLLVWDWRSATLLYDRLDDNMLAHTCLRAHPNRPYFVAQCRGNYATLYSTHAPYKRLKGPSIGGHRPPLRFSGSHEVEGYNIQCSFSHDATLWASGDANGRVVIYRSSGKRELVESFQLYEQRTACVCAEYQSSILGSKHVLLTGSSAGDVDLFQ